MMLTVPAGDSVMQPGLVFISILCDCPSKAVSHMLQRLSLLQLDLTAGGGSGRT